MKKVEKIIIGDKEYSLNDIWRLCLKMWKAIKDESYACTAKRMWLRKHGFNSSKIRALCFFCEWAAQHDDTCDIRDTCDNCPGKLVSDCFNCDNVSYNWLHKPKKFYKKILVLDKKRRSK